VDNVVRVCDGQTEISVDVTLARAVNHRTGVPETEWEPVRRRGPAGGETDGAPDAPGSGGSDP
jgi:hypothetical protein